MITTQVVIKIDKAVQLERLEARCVERSGEAEVAILLKNQYSLNTAAAQNMPPLRNIRHHQLKEAI